LAQHPHISRKENFPQERKTGQIKKRLILAPVMERLRHKFIRIAFLSLTGLAFLNLGFVLLEVDLLQIDKQLPVFSALSAGAEEEEQGEGSAKEQGKEIDLHVGDHLSHHNTLSCNELTRERHLFQLKITAGFASKFSPPPENS
jgi:hypothetical protein